MNRTTPAQRRCFYQGHGQGQTYQEIAASAGVSKECVRYWCRRQRDGGHCESLYQRSGGGELSRFAPLVRYVILRLKLAHPRWGRERIHYHLDKRSSCRGYGLPHPSSIGRYLHQWPRFRRLAKAKPQRRERAAPPTAVHQRWQLDFKVNIEQADGQQLALHTLVDQYSGACIYAQLLAIKPTADRGERVTWRQAQTSLRCGFAAWGTLPQEVQTDGEPTLIGRAGVDFPTAFSLWLKGLGIAHLVIRSGQATDNAEVERGHRTVNDYGVVGHEKTPLPELQLIVRQSVKELAFELPSRAKACRGRPPVTAYPALLAGPRPYQLAHELARFDLTRVDAFLASLQWVRKADQVGQVQIGGKRRRYGLGRAYAYQPILIRFDPTDRHFVFYPLDHPDQEIKRRPIRGVTTPELIGLADPNVELVPQQLPLFPLELKG